MAYSTQNVLGYYCKEIEYCGTENLTIGQSCSGPQYCSTNCCESTVCQSKEYCFEKYLLPFIIIFAIVILFIVVAALVFCIYWCKQIRADKKRRKLMQEEDIEKKQESTNMNINETE